MVLVLIPRSIIGHKAEHRVWSHEEEKACKMQQMGIRIFPLWALGTTVGERTTNHNQEKAQRHQGDNKSLDFFLAFVFDNSFFCAFSPFVCAGAGTASGPVLRVFVVVAGTGIFQAWKKRLAPALLSIFFVQ